MKKQIIHFLAISVLTCVSCAQKPSNNDQPDNTQKKQQIEEVIRNSFANADWDYKQYIESDSTTVFRLGFEGNKEPVDAQIIVPQNGMSYQIITQPRNLTITPEYLPAGLVAINEYNLSASIISTCINDDGKIIFWVGRNIVDSPLTEDDLMCDFLMAIHEADVSSTEIYLEAVTNK